MASTQHIVDNEKYRGRSGGRSDNGIHSGFLHVCSLFALVVAAAVWIFTTCDLQWSTIDHMVVGSSIYNESLPPLSMAYWRVFCAVVVFASLGYIYCDRTALQVTVLHRDGSKRLVALLGFERFTMFTVWAWILQGVYFTLTAYCSYTLHLLKSSEAITNSSPLLPLPSSAMLCTCWVLFEVSFSISYIVSSIVSFVLIPSAKKNDMPTANFYRLMPLLMHNGNVIFMATELLINRFSFCSWHFPFMILFGNAYSAFAWVWNYCYGYYYYFFLDYQRPGAVFWYIGLMLAVTAFFFAGLWTSYLLKHVQSNWPTAVILLGTYCCCKVSKS